MERSRICRTMFHWDRRFTYQANDGSSSSDVVTVSLIVNGVPVAAGDAYQLDEDTVLNVSAAEGVLINDSDPDSDPISAILIDDSADGTLQLNPDGSFDFEPNADFEGVTTFTYVATDGISDSELATVTVVVNSSNDRPVAVPDTYNVAVNGQINVPIADGILSNDTDSENDSLTAAISTNANGTLELNPDGSFTYSPVADFQGIDSFDYTAGDGTDSSLPTTVTIFVNSVPETQDDEYSVAQDTTLSVASETGVLANDTDADVDASLAARLVVPTQFGSVSLNADGSFEFVPNAGFVGTDAFTYVVNDGLQDSDETLVVIDVLEVDGTPVANDDALEVDEDGILPINIQLDLIANDVDPNGDTLIAEFVEQPSNGVLTFDSSFIYVPDPDFNGTDSFTYRANDGDELSNLATVTITVRSVDDAPGGDRPMCSSSIW